MLTAISAQCGQLSLALGSANSPVVGEDSSKEQICAALDCLCARAKQQMDEADPIIVSLKPTLSDWMTLEEMAEMHRLKMLLPTFWQEREAAGERLRVKLEARRK